MFNDLTHLKIIRFLYMNTLERKLSQGLQELKRQLEVSFLHGACKGYNIGTTHKHFFLLALCVCVNFIIGPSYITWTFQREKLYTLVGGNCGIQWLYTVRTITSNLVGSVNVSPIKNLSVGFVHVKEH